MCGETVLNQSVQQVKGTSSLANISKVPSSTSQSLVGSTSATPKLPEHQDFSVQKHSVLTPGLFSGASQIPEQPSFNVLPLERSHDNIRLIDQGTSMDVPSRSKLSAFNQIQAEVTFVQLRHMYPSQSSHRVHRSHKSIFPIYFLHHVVPDHQIPSCRQHLASESPSFLPVLQKTLFQLPRMCEQILRLRFLPREHQALHKASAILQSRLEFHRFHGQPQLKEARGRF